MCTRVESRIAASDPPPEALEHRSRPLTREIVADSALILTASIAERSAVARLDPTARSRTFTLKEAVALASIDVDLGEPPSDAAPLARFASSLHARRGFAAPPPRRRPASRWFSRRLDSPPFDVVDGHLLGGKQHELALDDLTDTVERLLGALRRVTA